MNIQKNNSILDQYRLWGANKAKKQLITQGVPQNQVSLDAQNKWAVYKDMKFRVIHFQPSDGNSEERLWIWHENMGKEKIEGSIGEQNIYGQYMDQQKIDEYIDQLKKQYEIK